MQNEQAQSTVTLNGEQAKYEMSALEKRAKDLKQAILDANKAGDTKAYDKYSKQLKETQKQMKQLTREAFDVKKVLNDLSGASVPQLEAAERKLRAAMRSNEVKRGSKEWEQYRENLVRVRTEIRNINKENQAGAVGAEKFSGGFRQMVAGAIAGIAALTGITRRLEEFRQERLKLEDSQASLKSITGLDDKDIEWLTDYARKLSTSMTKEGVRIKATSSEIIEGYTVIGSKRPELLKNKEAMAEVTKQALTLAAAGKIDTVEAFEAVTASMNQFNHGADQANRIINVLGAGSLEGSAEIGDLAGSMKNAGTVAASSNLSLEQTIALLEVLASKQLLGEEAGTKLRGAILKMKEANVGYTSGLFNMRDGLSEINQKLADKKTAAERDAYMQKVFGTENITAGQILLDNVENYERLTKAITGTTVAEKQAVINTSTDSAKWAQKKNTYNEIGMSLVKKLNPALLELADNGISVLQVFVKYPGLAIALVSVIGLLTAAYIANTVAAMAHVLWTKAVATATDFAESKTAKFTKTLLGNPYVAVGVAIIALTAIIYKYTTAKTAAEKAERNYNEAVGVEITKADQLFSALKKAAEGSEERRIIIDKINTQYGDYLGYQLTEKDNLNKIATAQEAVNRALREKYAIQIKDSSKATVIESAVNDQTKLIEGMSRILEPKIGEGASSAMISQAVKDMEKKGFNKESANVSLSNIINKLGKANALNPVKRHHLYILLTSYANTTRDMNNDLAAIDRKFDPIISKNATKTTPSPDPKPTEGEERLIDGKLMVYQKGKWVAKKIVTPPPTDKERKEKLQKNIDHIDAKTTTSVNDVKKKYLEKDPSVDTEIKYQDKVQELVIAGLEEKKKLYAKSSKEWAELDGQIFDTRLKGQQDQERLTKEQAAKALESFKKSHESELSTAKANDILARKQIEKELEDGVITQDQYDKKIQDQDMVAAQERLRIAQEYSKDVKTFQFSTEEERITTINAANEEELDAQKAFQVAKKKMVKDDLEAIRDLEQRNGLSDFQQKRGQYHSDLALLKEALKNKKITLDRYQKDVQKLNVKFAEDKAEDVLNIANEAARFSSTLQESETLAIENKYAKQLKAAEGNAEATTALQEKMEDEKKKIKKKYADVDLAIAVAQTVANTAAAIMKASPNVPLMVLTGLTGASELALAVEQRNQVKNLWTGGYTAPGDKYKPAGIVHAGEFVGNQDAVDNPSIRRVFDLIDYAQKTNSVAQISHDDIAKAAGIRRGYSAGGNVGTLDSTVRRTRTKDKDQSFDRYIRMMERLEKKMDEPFTGYVTMTGPNGIDEQTKKLKQLKNNASRL
jgi:TP901 family phage tail tape measure protein